MTGYDAHAAERWVPEPAKAADADRSPFVRDRARVLHSAALRRLAAKTQVVGVGVADFPRTRLTHSLECAQIGREIAAALGADPDVVDAACLAHDLGHPPFGHNGETALDEAAAPCGGFEGNAQSLRILTRLEAKVEGAGLNLTRAVLDAAAKYPWPKRTPAERKYGVYDDDRPVFDWLREGAPGTRRCLEAQIMDWADDVAYSVHDVEDGVVSGHVPLARLGRPDHRDAVIAVARDLYTDQPREALEQVWSRLVELPYWPRDFDATTRSLIALKRLTSELTGRFCLAVIAATRGASGGGELTRYAAELQVPDGVRAEVALLKAVAARYVMFRDETAGARARERDLVLELVEALARSPHQLEPPLQAAYQAAVDDRARLRAVVDQVATLTDTSARAWHARLVRA